MMDTLLPLIPSWVWVLLALFVAGLALSAVIAFLTFLFKLGVVLYEARKPAHLDAGDYRLAQGHEVRPEEHQRRKRDDADQS